MQGPHTCSNIVILDRVDRDVISILPTDRINFAAYYANGRKRSRPFHIC